MAQGLHPAVQGLTCSSQASSSGTISHSTPAAAASLWTPTPSSGCFFLLFPWGQGNGIEGVHGWEVLEIPRDPVWHCVGVLACVLWQGGSMWCSAAFRVRCWRGMQPIWHAVWRASGPHGMWSRGLWPSPLRTWTALHYYKMIKGHVNVYLAWFP